ncbi:MAG: RnfABCDGE type electron transport complex subunit D [Chloroflexota bacterium]
MLRTIDNQLNKITMYRLVLYYLIALLGAAVIFSAAGLLAYDVYALLASIGFLLGVSWITNRVFAWTFGVPANVESVYISALILALIITPIQSLSDFWFLLWAAVLAMASKYIVAIKGRHLFNPIAFAVALTYFATNQSASWWVGNSVLLPLVLIGGLLIIRKVGRFEMVGSFLGTALAVTVLASTFTGNFLTTLKNLVLLSPLVFFASIILTEPLTTPPTRKLRMIYGAIVGFLFVPQLHLGAFYITPELAIILGNIYSYYVSPQPKLILKLKEKVRLSPDVYEFVFAPAQRLKFAPGQYMEWTLGHHDPDTRGNRRYLTLASSPTEQNLKVGVKFYKPSSSFKKAMFAMDRNTEIVASQITGDFTLPLDPNQRCVFLAGGIGITPFRSMIKYLLDTRQRRPITLIYAAKTTDDIVYKDLFDQAEKELGLKVIYTLTDSNNVPTSWKGNVGRITKEMILKQVPSTRSAHFYLSGSRAMIDSFKEALGELRIPNSQIITDYFAGLA